MQSTQLLQTAVPHLPQRVLANIPGDVPGIQVNGTGNNLAGIGDGHGLHCPVAGPAILVAQHEVRRLDRSRPAHLGPYLDLRPLDIPEGNEIFLLGLIDSELPELPPRQRELLEAIINAGGDTKAARAQLKERDWSPSFIGKTLHQVRNRLKGRRDSELG